MAPEIYNIERLKLRLHGLIAWRDRRPRPKDSNKKYIERWRVNRALITVCEALITYVETLGPDWFAVGLPHVFPFGRHGVEEDDVFLLMRGIELNRKENPLPTGTVEAHDHCILFQGVMYSTLPLWRRHSYPTLREVAEAVLNDVANQYGRNFDVPAMES